VTSVQPSWIGWPGDGATAARDAHAQVAADVRHVVGVEGESEADVAVGAGDGVGTVAVGAPGARRRTRLTRVTAALDEPTPALTLAVAGVLAPDWSGDQDALAVKDFLDRFGRAGMARGAIVVVISDGWVSSDPLMLLMSSCGCWSRFYNGHY